MISDRFDGVNHRLQIQKMPGIAAGGGTRKA